MREKMKLFIKRKFIINLMANGQKVNIQNNKHFKFYKKSLSVNIDIDTGFVNISIGTNHLSWLKIGLMLSFIILMRACG